MKSLKDFEPSIASARAIEEAIQVLRQQGH